MKVANNNTDDAHISRRQRNWVKEFIQQLGFWISSSLANQCFAFSQLIQILNHWKTRAQNSKKNISRNAKVTFLRGCTNPLTWYHQWSFQIHLALLTLCVKCEGFPVLFFFFFNEADKNLALYFSAFIK